MGDGWVSVIGWAGGFEVELFVEFFYDEFCDDDKYEMNYGVVVLCQVFRIKYEEIC